MKRNDKRVARVSADFVEPGDLLWRPDGFHEVHESRRGMYGTWIIRHSGGGWAAWTATSTVEIEDDSGLKQLRYDVTRIGPYVTTTTFNPEKAGSIHFANVRTSGPSVVLADLIIRQDDQTVVTLEAVELGHLRQMAHELEREARAGEPIIGGGSGRATGAGSVPHHPV